MPMAPKQKKPGMIRLEVLPPVKHPARLQRKTSSASAIEIGSSTSLVKNDNQSAPSRFPKLERKSSSLQELHTFNDSGSVNLTKAPAKEDNKKKKLPKSGWGAFSGNKLPAVGSSSGEIKSPEASIKRTRTRRRRPGDIVLSRAATIAVVVKYELGQHELKKFKTCFNQIDLDASGVIDYDEFFDFIDETKTPFSEGLFRMIDSDSNGTIDYEEFVHAMVLYCMYTRDEILHFAFNTFDPAGTGVIGDKELRRLVSIVNDGDSKFSGNILNALTDFDRNKDGVIDFEEFKDRMQKSTLGDRHWLQLHKRLYQRLKTENYQRKHNGALPTLTVVDAIVKFLHLDTRDIYEP